ncbi:MAG: hypothetical protein IPO80_04555 [Propionibacteriaceae bacterium]|mgnify:CR=1 FL=1|nr:hypothetical protein [Propionibacteriaceae bacterium]
MTDGPANAADRSVNEQTASRGLNPWVPIDVSDWVLLGVEQAGTNSVIWLRDPNDHERVWLHKNTSTPISTGVEQGEDWAEVAATHVAVALGVPCADTRLCRRHGRRGSLSLSVRPNGHDLNEGRVALLSAHSPGYVPHVEGEKTVDPARPGVKRPGHSLANIKTALHGVQAPPGFKGPAAMSGFDVFVGYVILDALVANRDRHEQNWAVLRPQLVGLPDRLAPSYDHGGSLGYNLSDAERERRLSDPISLTAWARKGTAHRFEHVGQAPSLVDHAVAAISLASPEAAQWWQGRLASLDLSPLSAVLAQGVPGMSLPAATFTNKLLNLNLRRLQDAICIGS